MKRKLGFLALAAIGLASCNGGFKKGDGGLLYDIVKDNSGQAIKEGDFVALNFVQKTDADSVLASTYENGSPVPLIMHKPQYKGDIYAGLMLLREGDSAIVKTNIDSTMAKGQPRPKGMKGKYTVFVIKVEKVIPKGNLGQEVFMGRCKAYIQTLSDIAKKQEPIKIQKYIADNSLKMNKTDSGLYYLVTKSGAGDKPVEGDTVVVNYTLKFITGKAVETSIKSDAIKYKLPINPMNPYKPIRFPLGTKGMIKGWDQGMRLLNKGSKAMFIIPSSLAYGEQGNGQVQPFTTLVFEIELVDIVHPNPNAPKPVVLIPPVQAPRQVSPVKK
ncbi:MAG TPA: FKBP-type peptidyl-prolyl cis-trans isomerase [Mucilaginibacter sp.]